MKKGLIITLIIIILAVGGIAMIFFYDNGIP